MKYKVGQSVTFFGRVTAVDDKGFATILLKGGENVAYMRFDDGGGQEADMGADLCPACAEEACRYDEHLRLECFAMAMNVASGESKLEETSEDRAQRLVKIASEIYAFTQGMPGAGAVPAIVHKDPE